jgi:two-component system sensor histidine kinase/response regulator
MVQDIQPRPKGDILVVDDSPANLRLLSSMLTEQGYKVRSVISGPMALTAARAAPPNLILLDINMPEMSGFQVCQELKAGERTLDIPIIFISALDEIKDKLQAFTVGGVDYVTKPFQFQEVLARVETHLALRDLQRQLQEANVELERRLAELQARNEELDAFAHTVAHDLKNPLSSLLGFGGLLEARGSQLQEEQRARAAEAIVRSARKMDSIIEELLLLAGVRKMETVEMEPLDMAAIVAEAQSRLSDLIDEDQAELILPESWPAAMGHPAWVEEVWTNYLSNAIKYGGQPPIVHLGFGMFDWGLPEPHPPQSKLQNHKSQVQFWVRDNGPGLTPEEQARLFAPFERLHQVRVKGHGLGLSIVRRIVEKLGGQVGVESEPGRGSVFYFTLPQAASMAYH